ncbi:hypothetical protein AGOR_G00118440 [Albula goreensis]|uniref:non-specific serine/threonine protein kinase n=1 Tax=Albula goreensis TaxID=1534307 RepID=A0A8T3DB34_9TELE|nr:hypothetical protein AGOR_G00118440 [Albula goreensis]
MDMQNYVPRLNEFAQRSRANLRFEDVGTDGPDHCKTFIMRVVMDDKVYPEGVGRNKKEAKQNAAKNALEAIDDRSVQLNDSVTSWIECPSPCPAPGCIKQPNYVCWLNEYSQKMRVKLQPLERTKMGPANTTQSCRYVIDGKEYPEAFGNTKKEAKEEAAKAVYQELYGESNREAKDETQNDATGEVEMLTQNVSALSPVRLNSSLTKETSYRDVEDEKNYIGILNHYCQTKKMVHDYKLIERRGPAHTPIFVYRMVIDKKEYPEGQGKTAKEAKQHAAQLAWVSLQEQPDWNSQVSCRSTILEEGTSSPSSSMCDFEDKGITEDKADSTNDSVIFRNSLSGKYPKMAWSPKDIKPKIKLAPRFQMGNQSDQESGISSPVNVEKTTQSTNSLFLKDYDNIKAIAKGGFGRVFMARKKIEGKYVAVKIVKYTRKALREIDVLSDLQHSNIVRYYHSWIEDTRYQCEVSDSLSSSQGSGSSSSEQYLYIQMELCKGGTLKEWIDLKNSENDPERRNSALCIFQQVVDGVKYIHSQNLIHRDLKPANILFASENAIKIGDFGLVTSAECDGDESLLQRTKKTGTRSYMSPEQWNGHKYDKEVDIFALGLIYFELLWKIATHTEKDKIWQDVRSQKLPKQFCVQYGLEHKLIEGMLSEKPELRPDALNTASELTKYRSYLKKDQRALQEMKTMLAITTIFTGGDIRRRFIFKRNQRGSFTCPFSNWLKVTIRFSGS